jgi:hypothetical protein
LTVTRAAGGLVVKENSMLQKFLKVSLSSVLGVMALVLTMSATGVAEDKKDKKDEKVPTIKEIMQKGHKGTDAFIGKIKSEAKEGKWDEAKDHAKALALFGEYMGKNKPTKGDEKSWETLSKKYLESTKATLKAVEDKDAKAVEKALGTINCMECHKVHR